jgi:hypothetical protein
MTIVKFLSARGRMSAAEIIEPQTAVDAFATDKKTELWAKLAA